MRTAALDLEVQLCIGISQLCVSCVTEEFTYRSHLATTIPCPRVPRQASPQETNKTKICPVTLVYCAVPLITYVLKTIFLLS